MSPVTTLDQTEQDVVRTNVRGLLERSDAFGHLDEDQRRELAQGLVKLVGYLADPAAGQHELAADVREGRLARAQAEEKKPPTGVDLYKQAKKEELVGQEFEAGAMEAGVRGFQQLVAAVDFPEFVAGLIDGVFNSIVDASIRQMEAYGELVKAVVQSVDEFANENISPNQARDFLVNRHPGAMSIDIQSGQPRLAPAGDVDDEVLDSIAGQYNMQGSLDFDDETSEAQLVREAQLEMARSRQQMLATMVMMGINRIVVTDGLINAKVIFDIRTTDTAGRTATASMFDEAQSSAYAYSRSGGGWFSDGNSGSGSRARHKTTVESAVETTSESKAEMKAKLSGEVRVNFRSETVDLNQLASQQQISAMERRAERRDEPPVVPPQAGR